MKIHIPHFKEGVLTPVSHQYDPKQLDVEFVDLKYSAPLCLEGTVEKGRDTLAFRGRLTSTVVQTCGRCLITVKKPIDQSFELFYEIKGVEDLETTDDLRELLIIDHPIQFLCRPDCRGLCPSCGVNFNESKCGCDGGQSSRPFLALKKIWPQAKKEKHHGTS